MNKKGFTLVELLATVAILGILLTISFGAYTKINKNSLNTQLKNKLDYAQIAVNKYSEEHKDEIWEAGCKYIEIKDLINGGYISSDAKDRVYYENPVDGSDLSSKIYEICYDTSFQTSIMDNYDLYLKSLSISTGNIDPTFKKDNLVYTIIVPHGTKSVVIDAALGKEYMAFVDGYGPREANINVGELATTELLIKIIDPRENELTYKIVVTMDKAKILFDNRTCIDEPYTVDKVKSVMSYTGSWQIITDPSKTPCDYKIRFLTSGTLTVKEDIKTDVFVVGGGGGGCSDGWSCYNKVKGVPGRSNVSLGVSVKKGSYPIKIGGGAGCNGTGGTTSIFGVSATGGGSGRCPSTYFCSGPEYGCFYTCLCPSGASSSAGGSTVYEYYEPSSGITYGNCCSSTANTGNANYGVGGSGIAIMRNFRINEIGDFKFTYTGYYTITDDGDGNWRVEFLNSGTLDVIQSTPIDIFLVGGGGGGCSDGWSCYNKTTGAVASAKIVKNVNLSVTKYPIVIGGGGGCNGNGAASSLAGYSAAGGTSAKCNITYFCSGEEYGCFNTCLCPGRLAGGGVSSNINQFFEAKYGKTYANCCNSVANSGNAGNGGAGSSGTVVIRNKQ